MCRSRAGYRLLYKRGDGALKSMVSLQVHDSLIVGTQTFLNEESLITKSVTTNPRKNLSEEPILFNGLEITCLRSAEIFIRQ